MIGYITLLHMCNASRIRVHNFFRSYSLQDVVAIIEEMDDEDDFEGIYIEPPNGNISDEDSAEEDEGGLIDNLSSKQLQANAELVLSKGRRIGFGKWLLFLNQYRVAKTRDSVEYLTDTAAIY